MVQTDSTPLPEEPLLKQAAMAIRDAQQWGSVYDSRWRMVWASDAQIQFWGTFTHMTGPMGRHIFHLPSDATFSEEKIPRYLKIGGFVLANTPGGKDELRELVDPSLRHVVDDMVPNHDSLLAVESSAERLRDVRVTEQTILFRIPDEAGHFAGALTIRKPAGNAYAMAEMTSILSPRAMHDMQSASRAARRPAAILCADLDGSANLARSLSTASYFQLTRRLVFAADRCVVDAGGLVGRHAGDGVTAFFLTENLGSESGAARACVTAARNLRTMAAEVAKRSEIDPKELVVRFGLHWGSKIFVGAITTVGRFEVTAMGDEVNEAARIEACASGGLTLASKDLVERLTPEDANELGLEPSRMKYTQLADLANATEKARRDAPAIPVCEI